MLAFVSCSDPKGTAVQWGRHTQILIILLMDEIQVSKELSVKTVKGPLA